MLAASGTFTPQGELGTEAREKKGYFDIKTLDLQSLANLPEKDLHLAKTYWISLMFPL